MAIFKRQNSASRGKSTDTRGARWVPLTRRSPCTNTSDTAKKPTISTVKLMPVIT